MARRLARCCSALAVPPARICSHWPISPWPGGASASIPLVGRHAEPQFAYSLQLEGDCEALIKDRQSADARHKLRRKLNRLNDMGTLRFGMAEDEGTARAILAAFLQQKRARLAVAGITDPFAAPGVEDFLEDACCAGFASGGPAIRLFALWLDDRIIATYGAAVDATRFSGMFTAFDGSEDVFRWSPGEHLLLWLIRHHCAAGLAVFDLGWAKRATNRSSVISRSRFSICCCQFPPKGRWRRRRLRPKR